MSPILQRIWISSSLVLYSGTGTFLCRSFYLMYRNRKQEAIVYIEYVKRVLRHLYAIKIEVCLAAGLIGSTGRQFFFSNDGNKKDQS